MLRRLATALACALSIFLLNQSTPFSNPAPVLKSAGVGAEQESSAAVASSEAKPADVTPTRESDPTRSASGNPAAATRSSIEAAIGKESDAKIDLDSKQNDRSQASQQTAEPTRESICKVLSEAAEENDLPTPLFKRLIWQESRFRSNVVSPVGAKGIAQFMPGTAAERGLKNPFDPFQALPASAAFLRDLVEQFGNFGLAAAAYNGGPGRVSRWLAGKGGTAQGNAQLRDSNHRTTCRTLGGRVGASPAPPGGRRCEGLRSPPASGRARRNAESRERRNGSP